MAGLRSGRPGNPASDGGGADLRAALWPIQLVGIAGDDDLDAPDLPLQPGPPAPALAHEPAPPLAPALRRNNGKSYLTKPVVILEVDASGRQRDELLGELASIASFDAAAEWAKRIIPIKNTLTAEHAREVETALELKLGRVGNMFEEPLQSSEPPNNGGNALQKNDVRASAIVDRSALTFGHSPRRRNKAHLKFVASQPCLLCGRRPSDPHHLKFAQSQAMGRKVSDEFTVPLCRTHHRELHQTGNEQKWWARYDADPMAIAHQLWSVTHPLPAVPASADTVAPAADAKTIATAPQAADPDCETKPIATSGRHDVD